MNKEASSHSLPPLTLPEYERIFRAIHAVVKSEGGDPAKACLFFSIAGAYLLSKHHNLKNSRPVAGIAGYNLRTPTNFIIVLGTIENNKLTSNKDHFHCWIEVDGWIIDLTAPLFNDMAPIEQKGTIIRPLMFQKPILTDVSTLEDLNNQGAYTHLPNFELTKNLMMHFAQKPAHSDLISILDQWYVRHPKLMSPFVSIGDQNGKIKEVRLPRYNLEGKW